MSVYKNESDKRLVELSLCGDGLAFEELVIRHEKAVLGTAYKLTHDYQKAEDATQEAFAAAWMQLRDLTSQDKFGAYVCAIAGNYAKKRMIHEYRLPTVSLTDFENADFENEDPGSAEYAADDMRDRLREGTDSLREPFREAIRLHYYEGKSVKEIAAYLHVPEGTVKWRLSEGRKQLQKGFGIMDHRKAAGKTDFTAHVMHRIQELELCQLKNNRQGFSDAYQAALEAVNELPEKQKAYLSAELLCIGIQNRKPDEAWMAKWKQAILDGHNDMMMCRYTSWENHRLNGQEKIDYMRDVQIPFLQEHNFSLSVGYVRLMMAFEYFWEQKYGEALETVKMAKDLLEPTSDYYANAVSAISAWGKMLAVPGSVPTTRGEHLKMIHGALWYCESPGIIFDNTRLRDISRCDGCVFDPGISLGESKVSSCGSVTYTFLGEKERVETPAGVFENCRVYEVKENCSGGSHSPYSYRSKLFFCLGIGLVAQFAETNGQNGPECRRYLLSDYEIRGGEGWFPLRKGNRWAYTDVPNRAHTERHDAFYEVTSWNGTDAMLAAEEISYAP